MNMRTRQALVALSLFLFLAPYVIAASYRQQTTWSDIDPSVLNTSTCTVVNQIGYGSSKGLGHFTYTNSTIDQCKGLKFIFRSGDDSTVQTNSSWQEVITYDATALSAKYVGVCFNASDINNTGCNVDNLVLSYAGGGAIDDDTLEGLPTMGSDTGNFLKNLAPGIGAFIIILGIFSAIAAIVYAIVGVVKSKVAV